MKTLEAWWRRMRGTEAPTVSPVVPTPPIVNVDTAEFDHGFQLGVQHGMAIGETRGRSAVLSELESTLLSRMNPEYTLDDLNDIRTRQLH